MQEPFSSDVPVLPFLSIKLNCVMLCNEIIIIMILILIALINMIDIHEGEYGSISAGWL